MKIDYQPYKGTRDFYPEDYRYHRYIFKIWHQVLGRHGYEPYGASLIEPLTLYQLKNQSNQEILRDQIYTFEDRGGRQVALRPEMTPTLARMIAARRQTLPYPLRWYSTPNVWRYERPQKGRLREHWQLNVDIFDVNGLEAELELIIILSDIFKAFGASEKMYVVRLNSRSFVEEICRSYLKLDTAASHRVMMLLDRAEKLSKRDFKLAAQQIVPPAHFSEFYKRLKKLLSCKRLSDLPDELRQSPQCQSLEVFMDNLEQAFINNVVWDCRIVRGFDYYTDIVFEVFDCTSVNKRSLAGGGRYANLLSSFGVAPVSGAGFGMGDVTLLDFLRTHQLLPRSLGSVHLYIILMPETSYVAVLPLLKVLRQAGVVAVVDSRQVKPSKKIQIALKRRIDYVLFVGRQDLEDARFNLKHLPTGTEQRLNINRVATKLVAKK